MLLQFPNTLTFYVHILNSSFGWIWCWWQWSWFCQWTKAMGSEMEISIWWKVIQFRWHSSPKMEWILCKLIVSKWRFLFKLSTNSIYLSLQISEGVLHLPYAEIDEDFYAWVDIPNGRSRIDYYGGNELQLSCLSQSLRVRLHCFF